jgi:glucosyl-3-phosphoglycerate phosphatase
MTGRPGRRLLLLRHGRTSWNDAGRAQGHADVELDEVGHRQAAAVATYLCTLRPVALWSSDLTRARQTCGYLEDRSGLSAKYDERLREFDVGERQGLTLAEFAEAFPDEHAAWLRGDDVRRVPGAETTAEVALRMVPALRECLTSLHAGETGVVVTHGACLKVGLVGLLGWPTSQAGDLRGVHNCSWATITEVELDGRLRLAGYNESVPGDFASGSRVG